MGELKMAIASQDEINRAMRLCNLFEETCDCRMWTVPTIDGHEYYEDSEEYLQKFYNQVKQLSSGLRRVVFGYQVLLDNCCDKSADTLEWRPDLLKLIKNGQRYQSMVKMEQLNNQIIHDNVVVMQCVMMDIAQGNEGKALRWLHNALFGPGHLPDHLMYDTDEWFEHQRYEAYMERQAALALREMNSCN